MDLLQRSSKFCNVEINAPDTAIAEYVKAVVVRDQAVEGGGLHPIRE